MLLMLKGKFRFLATVTRKYLKSEGYHSLLTTHCPSQIDLNVCIGHIRDEDVEIAILPLASLSRTVDARPHFSVL